MFGIELNERIRKIEVNGTENLTFHLDSRVLVVSGDHLQECCEDVAFDFDEVPQQMLDPLIGEFVTKVEVSMPAEGGALLRFFLWERYGDEPHEGWAKGDQTIFVACHNIQNGYYSTALDLRLFIGGVAVIVGVEAFSSEGDGFEALLRNVIRG